MRSEARVAQGSEPAHQQIDCLPGVGGNGLGEDVDIRGVVVFVKEEGGLRNSVVLLDRHGSRLQAIVWYRSEVDAWGLSMSEFAAEHTTIEHPISNKEYPRNK